ncbi:unnamed protein product, partial [Amoebophrya sp. A25]
EKLEFLSESTILAHITYHQFVLFLEGYAWDVEQEEAKGKNAAKKRKKNDELTKCRTALAELRNLRHFLRHDSKRSVTLVEVMFFDCKDSIRKHLTSQAKMDTFQEKACKVREQALKLFVRAFFLCWLPELRQFERYRDYVRAPELNHPDFVKELQFVE